MTLRRPRAVLASAAAIVAVALGAAALTGCGGAPAVSTVGQVVFDRPLAIPPLAPSTVDADGTRVFELTAGAGATAFRDGVETPTWGYSAPGAPMSYLGPTLRAARGERVEVRVRNDLDEATTVHWHGMHLPAAMDGGPHQPVDPGEVWAPAWIIDQPAATLWYHPHPHGRTELHVRRGLAGMFLVDDPVEAALPLPRAYGIDDVPVIVQDVSFHGDGRIVRREAGFTGSLGDELLVNGTLGPYFEVTTGLVRLRLLNASTARVLRLAFADGRGFHMIASDGGLLAAPVELTGIQLSPGERAEIVVDFEPGERVVLRSEPPDLGAVVGLFGGAAGSGDRFDVLEFRAADRLAPSPELPAALAEPGHLDLAEAAAHRRFELDGIQINGREMRMDRIDEIVTVGTTESWTVRNTMAFAHNFHVHDVQFRIVSIGGAPPPPELAGPKDTVYLRPDTDYVLVMRFDDYADPEHPYMYHCHLLRHEDSGMMGQFLVVEAGADVPATWTVGSAGNREGSDHDH